MPATNFQDILRTAMAAAQPPPLPNLSCPANLIHHMSRFGYNLTGTGYRIFARDAQGQPINRDLMARFLHGPTDPNTAARHLLGQRHIQSPWLSLFRKWQSVLNRIAWFFAHSNPRAATVDVHIIDLDKCEVVPAVAFTHLLPKSRRQTLGHELLLWQGVPAARQADIVLHTMRLTRPGYTILPMHLGRVALPEDIRRTLEARAAVPLSLGFPAVASVDDYLSAYFTVRDPRTEMEDKVDTLRVVQALCVDRFDCLEA